MNCTKCIVRSLRANSRAPSDHGSIYGSGELLLDARDHDVARRLQDDHEEEGEGQEVLIYLGGSPRQLAG